MSVTTRALTHPVLVLIAAAALAVAWSAPALAHTDLRASTPEEGATVDSLSELRLEFTGDLLEIGAELTVVDSEGAEHELEPRFPSTNAVTGILDEEIPAGQTELVWRIVAEDGHDIQGVLAFTYAPPVDVDAPAPSPTASAGDEAESPADLAPEAPHQTPSPTASAVPDETEPGEMPAWVLPLLALVAAGGALVAILAARARQR
ncbi:copper resistance CopC family protein [Demequina sp. SO4-18]|uniref:copper resistance CopC family protein n=1 Tax=Demequina sp. SO4-18 TaxID=3401026 RepID=UPI003B58F4A1